MVWLTVKERLPKDGPLYRVRDKDGNEADAYACFYPFRVINKKIVPVEPYFDGWMVDCSDLDIHRVGEIVEYKELA